MRCTVCEKLNCATFTDATKPEQEAQEKNGEQALGDLSGWFWFFEVRSWFASQLSVMQQGTNTPTATIINNTNANHFFMKCKSKEKKQQLKS